MHTTIQKILNKKHPKVGNTLFIAIDGRGGSGKSTLTRLLAKQLGAGVIQTDDFAGWENPTDWWPLVIECVFEPIVHGATDLNYPRSKWWPTHHPEPVVNQPVTKIMILEGVTSLRTEFRDYISLGIFVDTPKDVCLRRGIARDVAYNTGKSEVEITKMWGKWQKNEDAYIARDNPKSFADIIIDGMEPLEKQLLQSLTN